MVGAAFLAAQVLFVVQAWLWQDNPRLLTPVEGLTRYELHATMDDRALDPAQIYDRYGIPASGRVALKAAALQQIIANRERPIPLSRALFVRLHTRQPNGTEEFWLWPQE